MFYDETLIRHMMEPAPGERGRPPLNQVSVEKIETSSLSEVREDTNRLRS